MPTDPETIAPILVLGLGNTIMGDDGAGIIAARAIGEKLHRTDVEVTESSAGALALIPILENRRTIFIIDAVRTTPCNPGAMHRLSLDDLASSATELSAHSTNLYTAVKMARQYGSQITDDIKLFLIEVESCSHVREGCSRVVTESVAKASEAVIRELEK